MTIHTAPDPIGQDGTHEPTKPDITPTRWHIPIYHPLLALLFILTGSSLFLAALIYGPRAWYALTGHEPKLGHCDVYEWHRVWTSHGDAPTYSLSMAPGGTIVMKVSRDFDGAGWQASPEFNHMPERRSFAGLQQAIDYTEQEFFTACDGTPVSSGF